MKQTNKQLATLRKEFQYLLHEHRDLLTNEDWKLVSNEELDTRLSTYNKEFDRDYYISRFSVGSLIYIRELNQDDIYNYVTIYDRLITYKVKNSLRKTVFEVMIEQPEFKSPLGNCFRLQPPYKDSSVDNIEYYFNKHHMIMAILNTIRNADLVSNDLSSYNKPLITMDSAIYNSTIEYILNSTKYKKDMMNAFISDRDIMKRTSPNYKYLHSLLEGELDRDGLSKVIEYIGYTHMLETIKNISLIDIEDRLYIPNREYPFLYSNYKVEDDDKYRAKEVAFINRVTNESKDANALMIALVGVYNYMVVPVEESPTIGHFHKKMDFEEKHEPSDMDIFLSSISKDDIIQFLRSKVGV